MTYRVWNAVNRPFDTEIGDWPRHFLAVPTPGTGYEVIEFVCRGRAQQTFQERSEFGLEVLTGRGWTEWYDDGGFDVVEHFEMAIREREAVTA